MSSLSLGQMAATIMFPGGTAQNPDMYSPSPPPSPSAETFTTLGGEVVPLEGTEGQYATYTRISQDSLKNYINNTIPNLAGFEKENVETIIEQVAGPGNPDLTFDQFQDVLALTEAMLDNNNLFAETDIGTDSNFYVAPTPSSMGEGTDTTGLGEGVFAEGYGYITIDPLNRSLTFTDDITNGATLPGGGDTPNQYNRGVETNNQTPQAILETLTANDANDANGLINWLRSRESRFHGDLNKKDEAIIHAIANSGDSADLSVYEVEAIMAYLNNSEENIQYFTGADQDINIFETSVRRTGIPGSGSVALETHIIPGYGDVTLDHTTGSVTASPIKGNIGTSEYSVADMSLDSQLPFLIDRIFMGPGQETQETAFVRLGGILNNAPGNPIALEDMTHFMHNLFGDVDTELLKEIAGTDEKFSQAEFDEALRINAYNTGAPVFGIDTSYDTAKSPMMGAKFTWDQMAKTVTDNETGKTYPADANGFITGAALETDPVTGTDTTTGTPPTDDIGSIIDSLIDSLFSDPNNQTNILFGTVLMVLKPYLITLQSPSIMTVR